MTYYANKSFVGQIRRAETDGILQTPFADISYEKGDYIFEGLDGYANVIDAKSFAGNDYIPVEIKKKKKKSSDFVNDYIKALQNFEGLNQEEDEDYINGQRAMLKNN
ncbi:hypothetical protein [Bacillus smithii]|uniref:hypothetical protein n=1 Tax=Bacillus smithii TaxID=1479 RepID=UPI002E231525|nr:hypothetical protein [Bacillus smithii]MED4928276.1 hypothetical protein [Bacillus smithii]